MIDTHTHVVAPDQERYPLSPRSLSGTWYLDGPCSAPDLAAHMTASGVSHAVLVQGVGAYSHDNRYAVDSAEGDPAHFVSACCIDICAPDAPAQLSALAQNERMQGVRVFAVGRDAAPLDSAAARPAWVRAADLGLHVIVTILPPQLPQLRTLLEAFPGLPVSLDHCGFPDPEKPEPLLELGQFEALHLKVTTHVLDASRDALGAPGAIVTRLANEFGGDRLMWGSDFCQIHDRSYAELVELGRDAFASLPAQDREGALRRTPIRLYPGLGT